MKSIRKLFLQNTSGQRFGLNGQEGVYASNLAGFGFSVDPEFADLGRGFFRNVGGVNEPQQPVPFTITFTRNPYNTYRRFIDWLFSAGALTLVYKPFGEEEYFRAVEVNSVQKGELSAVGWLECPCILQCLTPWYRPAPTVLTLEAGGSSNSKRYPYRYTEDLRYGTDSTSALTGTIFAAGHIPGALDITFTGAIVNPKIHLQGKLSGRTYGVCSAAVELGATDTLRFSSRYENSFVAKITAGGAQSDLLDKLDLSAGPFFHMPVDEPCTLTIESDDLIAGTAHVAAFYYYRSV